MPMSFIMSKNVEHSSEKTPRELMKRFTNLTISPLHEENRETSVSVRASSCGDPSSDTCLLLQRVRTKKGWANVMWDNAASLSFITNSKAKVEMLHGTRVEISTVKVGGTSETIMSNRYLLPLINSQGQVVPFEVYGIDVITADIQTVSVNNVVHLFKYVALEEISRPTGSVDMLIGYGYVGYHPVPEQKLGHLLLLRNRFGRCLGGTHAELKDSNHAMQNAIVHHVAEVKIEDFYNTENLGVECTPRCGGRKCGKCPLGAKNYSLNEEKELELMERNLHFNNLEHRWMTPYPWTIERPHLECCCLRKRDLPRILTTQEYIKSRYKI